MDERERLRIHALFERKDYLTLYQTQKAVIHEMLSIEEPSDFEDFLEYEDGLEEDIFWLYQSAMQGDSLRIDGYEGDVTEKVTAFLEQKLPSKIVSRVKRHLRDFYVDLGTRDTAEERLTACNQSLADTNYRLQMRYEDTYCAGAYFLSVLHA